MFDYNVIAHCQYEILGTHNNPFDCGEPATHQVWWEDFGKDMMKVCREHFDFMVQVECAEDGSNAQVSDGLG